MRGIGRGKGEAERRGTVKGANGRGKGMWQREGSKELEKEGSEVRATKGKSKGGRTGKGTAKEG